MLLFSTLPPHFLALRSLPYIRELSRCIGLSGWCCVVEDVSILALTVKMTSNYAFLLSVTWALTALLLFNGSKLHGLSNGLISHSNQTDLWSIQTLRRFSGQFQCRKCDFGRCRQTEIVSNRIQESNISNFMKHTFNLILSMSTSRLSCFCRLKVI